MKSPTGWGLASVWYDKFQGMPPRGSLLETLFVLVKLSRVQAEMRGTKALVQGILGLSSAGDKLDPAIQAFEEYYDQMLPFLERVSETEDDKDRKRLAEFVKHPVRINLNPIYQQQAQHARRMAALDRFKIRPKVPGTY